MKIAAALLVCSMVISIVWLTGGTRMELKSPTSTVRHAAGTSSGMMHTTRNEARTPSGDRGTTSQEERTDARPAQNTNPETRKPSHTVVRIDALSTVDSSDLRQIIGAATDVRIVTLESPLETRKGERDGPTDTTVYKANVIETIKGRQATAIRVAYPWARVNESTVNVDGFPEPPLHIPLIVTANADPTESGLIWVILGERTAVPSDIRTAADFREAASHEVSPEQQQDVHNIFDFVWLEISDAKDSPYKRSFSQRVQRVQDRLLESDGPTACAELRGLISSAGDSPASDSLRGNVVIEAALKRAAASFCS